MHEPVRGHRLLDVRGRAEATASRARTPGATAESTTTRLPGATSRSRGRRGGPVQDGIARSSTTRSGWWSPASATACSPSPASATTSTPGYALNRDPSSSRRSATSSTSSTRTADAGCRGSTWPITSPLAPVTAPSPSRPDPGRGSPALRRRAAGSVNTKTAPASAGLVPGLPPCARARARTTDSPRPAPGAAAPAPARTPRRVRDDVLRYAGAGVRDRDRDGVSPAVGAARPGRSRAAPVLGGVGQEVVDHLLDAAPGRRAPAARGGQSSARTPPGSRRGGRAARRRARRARVDVQAAPVRVRGREQVAGGPVEQPGLPRERAEQRPYVASGTGGSARAARRRRRR